MGAIPVSSAMRSVSPRTFQGISCIDEVDLQLDKRNVFRLPNLGRTTIIGKESDPRLIKREAICEKTLSSRSCKPVTPLLAL